MIRTPSLFTPLRSAAAVLVLAAATLAGCGSAPADSQSAAAEASATATDAASAGAKTPDNLAVSGPTGNYGDESSHNASPAAHDSDESPAATDENGEPVPAGPPQVTEEDVRRAVEEAQNK